MVSLNISLIISQSQSKLLSNNNLAVLAYTYLRKRNDITSKIQNIYQGEVENLCYSSFKNKKLPLTHSNHIYSKLKIKKYLDNINIFRLIGIFLQRQQHNQPIYNDPILLEYFDRVSIKHQYLLQSFFSDLKERFIINLKKSSHSDIFEQIIFFLNSNEYHYSNISENISQIVPSDILELIIMEDFNNIKYIKYEEIRKKLILDIIWIAIEIQSKHKVFNNNEDQYNAIFHTMLNAKEYFAENQSQRGVSHEKKTFGELDVSIYTKDKFPLSILEGFIIKSIEKKYIQKHLVKLSENYDPNGLKQNFAVVYTKNKNFTSLWNRYLNFLREEMKHPIPVVKNGIIDITNKYPNLSNIKIGLSIHNKNNSNLEVYHIFINCYY